MHNISFQFSGSKLETESNSDEQNNSLFSLLTSSRRRTDPAPMTAAAPPPGPWALQGCTCMVGGGSGRRGMSCAPPATARCDHVHGSLRAAAASLQIWRPVARRRDDDAVHLRRRFGGRRRCGMTRSRSAASPAPSFGSQLGRTAGEDTASA